jgi:hypothetical protein
MELLQERAAEVIVQTKDAKKNMAQTQAECAGIVSDEIVVQVLDALKEKTTQAQKKEKELTEKFQAIPGEIDEAHKVYVAQDEPHVSVGGLLDVGRIRKKGYFWKRSM